MNRRVLCTLGVFLLLQAGAARQARAQTRGRVGVGVGATTVRPHDAALRPTSFINAIVRLNPGEGWGLAGALDWFNADLAGPLDGVGRVEIRPLMGGVGYGFKNGPVWTSFSVVGGPAWSRLRLNDSARDTYSIVKSQRITLAIRPGASVTVGIAPRVGITGFAGYMFNRPHFTLRTSAGDFKTTWRSDAAIFSAGIVYSLF
jgi:hypothetical protein